MSFSLRDPVSETNALPVEIISGGAGGGAVTVADGANVAEGAKADAAYAGSGSASLIAINKGVYNLLAAPLPAAVTTAAPTYTTGTTNNLSLTTTGDLRVQATGNIASGVADSGNPVKVGGLAQTTAPTAVTSGQRQNLWLGLNGQTFVTLATSGGLVITAPSDGSDGQTAGNSGPLSTSRGTLFNGTSWDRQRGDVNGAVTQPHAMSGSRWSYAAATGGIVSSTTAVTVSAAQGVGVRNYLAMLQIDWDSLTTATEVAIRDDAGGTVLWRGKLPSGSAGQRTIAFAVPLRGTANKLMEAVVLTSTAGGVFFNVQGFTGV